MKKLTILLVSLIFVISILAVMCWASATIDYPISGLGKNMATDVKANKPLTLACIVKNSTNPYMVKQLEGFEMAGEAMGFTAITMAPAKQDNIEEQIRIVEDLMQRGVDGIAIHPSDSNGIVPIVEKAIAKGIPVISIGTPANTDKTLCRTGVDYKETGIAVGKWIAEKLNGKGDIIIIEGPPQATNAHERDDGIREALEKYGPDIKILASQTGNFRRIEGMQVMENFLTRFTKIDAVITHNDGMSMGALQAIEAAGRDKEGIIIAGFDATEDASHAILEGRMHVSYNTDPISSAWCAAAYLVKYLNDGTIPPAKFVPYPCAAVADTLLTKENVEEYIEISAWWK